MGLGPIRPCRSACAIGILLAAFATATHNDSWPIGGLFPLSNPGFPGAQTLKAAELAVSLVNNQTSDGSLWPGCNLTLRVGDSKANADDAARAAFVFAASQERPPLVVGPWRSDVAAAVAVIGRVTNTPTLSYSATSVGLEDADLFARTVVSDATQVAALIALLKRLWPSNTQAMVISSSSEYATSLVTELRTQARADSVSLQTVEHDPFVSGQEATFFQSLDQALDEIESTNSRLVVLNDSPVNARLVLSEMRRRGMAGLHQNRPNPYLVLGTDYFASMDQLLASGNNSLLEAEACDAACKQRVIDAAETIVFTAPSRADIAQWLDPWIRDVWDPATGPSSLTPEEKAITGLDSWRGDAMSKYAPYAFDAVLLGAATMRAMCADVVSPTLRGCGACTGVWRDGNRLYETMLRVSVNASAAAVKNGATGPVVLNSNGDRSGGMALKVFVASNTTFGMTERVLGLLSPQDGGILTLNLSNAHWPGNTATWPHAIGDCPPGKIAEQVGGATFCRACPEGSYNMDARSSCHGCPAQGAVCPGGESVLLQTGFWAGDVGDDGSIETYNCRPLPDVCCPQSNCPSGIDEIKRPWGTSTCEPERKGMLCGECRDGLSMWGNRCIRCEGVNWAVVIGLFLLTVVGLVLLTRLVPSERASNRLTLDYVQLVAVILVPVPGGRLSALASVMSNNLFNLDIASFIGSVGVSRNHSSWYSNGSLPLVEPPLPPLVPLCPMPINPLASTIVPLTLPLGLLALILCLSCVWKRLADRIFPGSCRMCVVASFPCTATMRPSWMRESVELDIRVRKNHADNGEGSGGGKAVRGALPSPDAAAAAADSKASTHLVSRESRVGRAAGIVMAQPPSPRGAAARLGSQTASSGQAPRRDSTVEVTNPISVPRHPAPGAASPSPPAAGDDGMGSEADEPKTVRWPHELKAKVGFRPDGVESEEEEEDDHGAADSSPAMSPRHMSYVIQRQGTVASLPEDRDADDARPLAAIRMDGRERAELDPPMDSLSVLRAGKRSPSPAVQFFREICCSGNLPQLMHAPEVRVSSGHVLTNHSAVELISGSWCWWFRLPIHDSTTLISSCCPPPTKAAGAMFGGMGFAIAKATRRAVRQRHWAYVRSTTVIRALLRWATVSANIVTATAWKLLAVRYVQGMCVLELQPAVRCDQGDRIVAALLMTVLLVIFALLLPAALVIGYEWQERRAGRWAEWQRNRIKRILDENAKRGKSVMERFIAPIVDMKDLDDAGLTVMYEGHRQVVKRKLPRWQLSGRRLGASFASEAELAEDERMDESDIPATGEGGGTPVSPGAFLDEEEKRFVQKHVNTEDDEVSVPWDPAMARRAQEVGTQRGTPHAAVRVAGVSLSQPKGTELDDLRRAVRERHAAMTRTKDDAAARSTSGRARVKRKSLGTLTTILDERVEASGSPKGGKGKSKMARGRSPSEEGDRAAFVEQASDPDAEVTDSMGRALWEVLRVYRPGVRGYYEAFVFVRRALLTFTVVFLSATPSWRQIAILCLTMVFLGVHLLVVPYASAFDNGYAGALIAFMVFIAGLETFNTPAYTMDRNHKDSPEAVVIAITELILLIIPVSLAVINTLRTLYRKGYLRCIGCLCPCEKVAERKSNAAAYRRRLSINQRGLGNNFVARMPKQNQEAIAVKGIQLEMRNLTAIATADVKRAAPLGKRK